VLEELAREMVGDGKSPDLFFVSVGGNIVMIAQDFHQAYYAWQSFSESMEIETALENRQYGVIASVEPEDDEPGSRLVRLDDSEGFRRTRR
jgi:hypothetical protein